MNYHDIETNSMLNGDGLRVVLWVSGCSLNCEGCHNPQTHPKNSGILFDNNAEKELFEKLDKDYISGLTISGGNPLEDYNYPTVLWLAFKFKQKFPNKNLWLYTGFEWKKIKDLEIMKYVDVLVDGKFIQDLADVNYNWAGSTNQKVIDVQKSLKSGKIILL